MLIEGVLFRARYLGSTQLICEGQPTKTTRMMQAEEAVARIKVSELRLKSRFCFKFHSPEPYPSAFILNLIAIGILNQALVS